jgi:alpha-maltose-1-phosphate synthase
MLHQQDILLEEYGRFGLRARVVHPKIVGTQLVGYADVVYISRPSQCVKSTFLERGVPADKRVHAPYGVNLTHFHPIPKQRSCSLRLGAR